MGSRVDQAVEKFKEQIDSSVTSYFSSCVHCGICAEACMFYTETNDPRYTPIYKLQPMRKIWKQEHTFWGKLAVKLGLSKPLTEADLSEWEELVYDSCTLCGRCSMVCPVGNDITAMIRKEREGMSAAGFAPDDIKRATERAIEIGSPMGLTLKTFEATIRRTEKEIGMDIPVDVKGADYLMLLSSAEIAQFHEIIPAVARIFKQAGVSWTFCSEAFEGTNSGIQIGSKKDAAVLVERIVSGAEKLQVKHVISPECGHAYTALRWEGPNLIGRPYPFTVIHILELLDELQREGRLSTEGLENERMTFHDPCQLVRRGGVVEQPRRLMKLITDDFVEMEDHGVMNWCCGGGGGVSAIERTEPLRLKVFDRKKKQLENLNVSTIVTACSNCRNMLDEGLEHNDMDMDIEVIGLTELLAEHLKQ